MGNLTPQVVRSLARGGTTAVIIAILTILLFALMEGCASLTMVARTLVSYRARRVTERSHTRYDSDLGWSNITNVHLADMSGPGVPLTINSQGFRGSVSFGPTPPAEKMRIVCSGDSYTLGWGVGDDETWCALLADRRIETVNMGQGGYGFDQLISGICATGSD